MRLRSIVSIVSLFGLVFLLWGCFGGPANQRDIKKPDWVTGENARYSSNRYITGRGQYKYLSRAKNHAREDIAEKFKIVINKETIEPLLADRTYTTSTPELLKAIHIVDAWENPVSGDQHVFAILARNKTIIALNQKIARLDDNTRSIINSTIISNDKLEKIALAHQALDTQIERFAYQQVLSKIYPTGQPVQQVWQISKLNNDFKKLLSRIRIKPDISIANDESNKIEQALVEGLKQSGITVDFSRSADFILHATLALDDYNKLIDSQYVTNGKLKLSLTDKKQNIRGTHTWPINISAERASMTNQKIGNLALQIFKLQLRSILASFAKKPT
ncbi:MAG: hypothetical protein GXP19_04700 [Gammaproteobacteria bacterium]|nr:hypothetical protein [Gammaproteobacteria bacterium]